MVSIRVWTSFKRVCVIRQGIYVRRFDQSNVGRWHSVIWHIFAVKWWRNTIKETEQKLQNQAPKWPNRSEKQSDDVTGCLWIMKMQKYIIYRHYLFISIFEDAQNRYRLFVYFTWTLLYFTFQVEFHVEVKRKWLEMLKYQFKVKYSKRVKQLTPKHFEIS